MKKPKPPVKPRDPVIDYLPDEPRFEQLREIFKENSMKRALKELFDIDGKTTA